MKCNRYAPMAGLAGLALASTVHAHGFVGERFFPPTITTEDPFAVDEFSLSTGYSVVPGDDGPETEQWSGGFEFTKEILPRFAVGVEGTYFRDRPAGGPTAYGWDNFGVSLKYELWQSEPHEAIVSIGLDTDIGGSGTHAVGESFTTFTPTLYFGKGFGDLPDALPWLKPLAVTGAIGQTLPTRAEAPNTLEWGFAVEYSIPYLQQHVRDVGLPQPLKSLIPLVEFAFETPENRGPRTTTGTINPGVLYESKSFQIGVEASIPVNRDSGRQVGVTVSLQLYLDDLFPQVFGHPVFGERP